MKLDPEQQQALLSILKARFEKHGPRHKGLQWADVASRLEAQPDKLWSLEQMEESAGEPDVVAYDNNSGEYTFMDCSAETPAGRRSICYDRQGWESRKEHRPANNAIDMATEMGIEMLTEAEYRTLQNLGTFDAKTSSWVQAPAAVRKLGGAIFCDLRYNTVFVYHNGPQSYYAGRGFRGSLRV